MAITFAEASVLTQNKLVKGIQMEMISESPMMARLPFEDVVGNAYAYIREVPTAMGSVAWAAANETLTSSYATFVAMTAALYRLYGQADVDNLIQASQSDGAADQMAAQVKIKARLMAKEFENRVIYGDTTTEGLTGLHAIAALTSGQCQTAGSSASGVLTLHKLNIMIDSIRGGPPSFILMSRAVLRRFSEFLTASASYQTERSQYGDYTLIYQGIPIIRADSMLQTETDSSGAYLAATGGVLSTVFAVRISNANGFHGIQNGDIKTEYWDKLEDKDARRTRMMWYCGVALKSTLALAAITGVTDAAVTA
jgi:hypothetical protein